MAAQRAGRDAREIKLIAATKTIPVPLIEEAISAGIIDIGENRIQDAQAKYPHIGNKVQWHMIGHLQTNKVKYAVRMFDMIQSVDSLRLAQEISRRALEAQRRIDILIEVKVSPESTKFGIEPEDALSFVREISELEGISVKGLMALAPLADDPEKTRPYFAQMRDLADMIAGEGIPGVEMRYLSMGMTNDFEVAIEE